MPDGIHFIFWSGQCESPIDHPSYEGVWSHIDEARFELCHHAFDETEFKLAELKRMVNSWKR
jgi:hypothetical protein